VDLNEIVGRYPMQGGIFRKTYLGLVIGTAIGAPIGALYSVLLLRKLTESQAMLFWISVALAVIVWLSILYPLWCRLCIGKTLRFLDMRSRGEEFTKPFLQDVYRELIALPIKANLVSFVAFILGAGPYTGCLILLLLGGEISLSLAFQYALTSGTFGGWFGLLLTFFIISRITPPYLRQLSEEGLTVDDIEASQAMKLTINTRLMAFFLILAIAPVVMVGYMSYSKAAAGFKQVVVGKEEIRLPTSMETEKETEPSPMAYIEVLNSIRNHTFIIGGIMILAAVVIAIFASRSITGPLNEVSLNLKGIAKGGGDLTKQLTTITRDEVGTLSRWFNEFVGSLSGIIKSVRATADKVSSSSQALSSSAQQMNATTVEISSTIQQISKGTTTQSQRVEETVKITDEIAKNSSQMADQAGQGAQSSELAARSAEEGKRVIAEVVEGMDRINQKVSLSSEVIQNLGQRSQQIGQIIDTITKISDQTNLLALNAAIEAARAGEAGRGFAVVAEEVRKLAESSASSATQISQLISGIQAETQKAVSSIEEGSQEVTKGREIVDKVSQAFSQIVTNVKQTVQVAQGAAEGIKQQLSGIQSIKKAVDEISSIAEQSASASQQASSSTQEATASMQEMASSAQELAQMAVDLRELVGRFKLEEEKSIEQRA